MAIDYTTPTIAPPGADDVANADPDFPGVDQYATGKDAPPVYDPDEDLGDYLSKASKAGIESPSRYASPIVQQGLDLIRQQGKTAQEESMATLDERMSQRGLIGSGVEATETGRLLEQLNQQRMGQEYGLLKDFAATESQDRATWANIAIQTRAQELTELGMSQDDAFRMAQLEQQKYQFGAEQEQKESEFSRALTEQQATRIEQFGFSREELDQRALEAQQSAKLQGRSLDIQEARDIAEIDMRLKSLQQEADLKGEEFDIERARMGLQSEQFDREIDLRLKDINLRAELEGRALTQNEARLQAEKDWTADELGERRADRLGRENISGRDLSLRADQIARDYKIRDKELARDYAELDLRREAQWQAAGVDAERLELDAKRLQDESRLAGEEMTLRKAMQEAEISQRSTALQTQIMADAEAQGRAITAEQASQEARTRAERDMQRDRISAERDMFREEMSQRQSEFSKKYDLDEKQYRLSRETALKEYGDRDKQRAHEFGLQEGTQEFQNQLEISQQLHERTLQDLIQKGTIKVEELQTNAEKAWRTARNTMEKKVADKEAELQTWMIDNEKARYAAEREIEKEYRTADRAAETKMESTRTAAQLLAAQMGMDSSMFEAVARILAANEGSLTDLDSYNMPGLSGDNMAALLALLAELRIGDVTYDEPEEPEP